MALETGTYISDLNVSNPANTDGVTQADDHLRLIKSTVKATFPNITGAVTPTQADLNKLTSAGNPQFSTIELGAASDTTLSRVSAGVIAVEGVAVPLNSITNTHTAQQIELGHASDTTITRSAAGVLAVEGGVIPKENRANTFSVGQLISTGASQALLSLQANAAVAKTIQFLTGANSRWVVSSEATAESGSDAGSNFIINSYNDAGAYLSTPFQIIRSTGNVGIGKIPSVTLDVAGQIRTMDGTVDLRMLPLSASSAGLVGTISNHAVVFTQNNAEAFRVDTSKNVLVTSSGGLGYGTGSGGAVTQLTSRTTGVTLNKTNGSITLFSAANSTTFRTFTVTNSTVAATDVILLSQRSGVDRQQLLVTNVAAGSFDIAHATTTGTTTEAPIINFAVIKAVTS